MTRGGGTTLGGLFRTLSLVSRDLALMTGTESLWRADLVRAGYGLSAGVAPSAPSNEVEELHALLKNCGVFCC